MTTKVLGYTGKFFAIWTLEITEEKVSYGCIKKRTIYRYGRKASKYLPVAKNKYPGVEVDDKLENKTRSFWFTETIWTTNDVFRFGKYKGQKIDDCTEVDYIAWYWQNIDGDHKKYVEKVLNSKGYKTVIKEVHDDDNVFKIKTKEMLSKDTIAWENEDVNNMSDKLKEIYTATELILNPTHNISNNGNYREDNIIYHFLDYRYYPATYYSPDYYLPTVNGKGVRIKNKKVLITKFIPKMENNKIIVTILKFKVQK